MEQSVLRSYDDMGVKLGEYFQRDDIMKELSKLQDAIKGQAREYAIINGTPDSKGTVKIDLPEGKIQLIVRESVSLDEDKTVEFLRSHGFDKAVCLKPMVDEEVVAELFREGSISIDDMRELVVKKSNTALYLRKPKSKDEQYTSTKDKGTLTELFAALEI